MPPGRDTPTLLVHTGLSPAPIPTLGPSPTREGGGGLVYPWSKVDHIDRAVCLLHRPYLPIPLSTERKTAFLGPTYFRKGVSLVFSLSLFAFLPAPGHSVIGYFYVRSSAINLFLQPQTRLDHLGAGYAHTLLKV
ncbi:hypothetical protein UPYG_G00105370 [Umbra pygmaea]|uniref:Uncharacterized protein n=1 Tax=Umbra pygmaea TaxID=75934 RepID=A0ABD0X252_UMBPY